MKSFSRQSRSRGSGIVTVCKSTLGSNITFKTKFDFAHTSFKVIIIIIIMVILKCYFSGELIALSQKIFKKKKKWKKQQQRCEHIIRKNKQIKSTVHDAN